MDSHPFFKNFPTAPARFPAPGFKKKQTDQDVYERNVPARVLPIQKVYTLCCIKMESFK